MTLRSTEVRGLPRLRRNRTLKNRKGRDVQYKPSAIPDQLKNIFAVEHRLQGRRKGIDVVSDPLIVFARLGHVFQTESQVAVCQPSQIAVRKIRSFHPNTRIK